MSFSQSGPSNNRNREVPAQKPLDGRIKKVDALTPILQAFPRKKKTTPTSWLPIRTDRLTIF